VHQLPQRPRRRAEGALRDHHGLPCRTCHAEIFKAYSGSMHGKARASGDHLDAPMCSECHRATTCREPPTPNRSARPASAATRPPCRSTPRGCRMPTSISPRSPAPPATPRWRSASSPCACRGRLGRQLTEREVGDLVGGDVAAAITSAGSSESGLNLWAAMRRLESRRLSSAAKLHIVGRLEIARGIDAHRLADKSGAVRDCESCHTNGSKVFDQVRAEPGPGRRPSEALQRRPGMLTDAASVLSIHGFYALGATRVGCSTGCSPWPLPAGWRSSRSTSRSASGPRAPTRKGDSP